LLRAAAADLDFWMFETKEEQETENRPVATRNGPPRRRRTDFEPNEGWRRAGIIAVTVAIADWTTKALVALAIPLGELKVVWEGRLAFWHVRNPALILGLFGDLPLTYRKIVSVLLATAALILLYEVVSRAHRLLPHRRAWAWLFSGLLLGGMLGNLGERSLHWWVTDFISFRWGNYWLPPGNVADLSIILALPISLIVILFELEARAQRGKAPSAG